VRHREQRDSSPADEDEVSPADEVATDFGALIKSACRSCAGWRELNNQQQWLIEQLASLKALNPGVGKNAIMKQIHQRHPDITVLKANITSGLTFVHTAMEEAGHPPLETNVAPAVGREPATAVKTGGKKRTRKKKR
jgi:hypothetical protein